MDDDGRDQALLDDRLDRALAPYRDLVPAEVLEELRGQLSDFIETHPAMERLFARIKPGPRVDRSGEVGRGATAEGDAAKKAHGGES